MHKHIRTGLIGLFLSAAAASAQAEPCCRSVSPYYASVNIYGVVTPDNDVEFYNATGSAIATLDHDLGFGVGLAGGFKLSPNFRAEIEGVMRDAEINSVNGTPLGTPTGGGYYATRSYSGLGNVYWDIARLKAVTPYIGAGAGITRLSLLRDKNEWLLAYQLMAGISYDLSDDGKTQMILGYRYFDTAEADSDVPTLPLEVRLDSPSPLDPANLRH
jgi:opacity protein-like surface antigen